MAAPVINLHPEGDQPDYAAAERELHRGQMRFADRFVTAYGRRFLHAHGIGWFEFDGVRWAVCEDGGEKRGVFDLLKSALRDDVHLMESDARKELLQDIQKVESAAGVNGVLDLASAKLPVATSAKRLDEGRHLLNTGSGTVDLFTGLLRSPDPADKMTKRTEAEFNPEARSAVFDAFLEQCQPNPEMRAYLARSLGSAMLGIVREQILFIWRGEGANGKGTLRDAVRHALGDYTVEVPPEILLQSKYGQQSQAPDRMRLRGARFAFCSEIDRDARMDEAIMKRLTGGDPVTAKLLYRDPIEFDPSHQLFMLTNHLPAVRGDDPAVWRRIQAVPFDVVVPADQRDGTLPEKLKDAKDAILAWVWRGWLDYQEQGLNPPQAVLDATKEYRETSDLLARFLSADSGQVIVGHGTVRSAELYGRFKQWCASEGEEAGMTNKAFTAAMEKQGHTRSHTKAGAVWQGMILADQGDEDDRRSRW